MKPQDRRAFVIKRANALQALRSQRVEGLDIRPLVVAALTILGAGVIAYVLPYYATAALNWGPAEIVGALALFALFAALAQTIFLKGLQRHFQDQTVIVATLVAMAALVLSLAVVRSDVMLVIVLVGLAFCTIAPTLLQARISAQAPPSRQGELQSIVSSLGALNDVVSPLLYSSLLILGLGLGGGAHSWPFLFAASCLSIGAWIASKDKNG